MAALPPKIGDQLRHNRAIASKSTWFSYRTISSIYLYLFFVFFLSFFKLRQHKTLKCISTKKKKNFDRFKVARKSLVVIKPQYPCNCRTFPMYKMTSALFKPCQFYQPQIHECKHTELGVRTMYTLL